jgi:hypothetical protein
MSFAEDEHAVGDLGPGGEHEPFRVGVGPRDSRWDLHTVTPASVSTASKASVNCPAPVPDQESELVDALAQVDEQIPGLLDCPRPVGVGGDAEDVHVSATDLQHENTYKRWSVSAQST